MKSDSKILVAGANGMVGSAIVRNLESKGYSNIIRGTRSDVDFTNQDETERYFCSEEPEYVFLAAAKVGGIYPKFSEVPIVESSLLSGPLEPTNDAYAIAKIAGIKMCQSYREQYGFNAISVMPCNLYGINDSFDLETCHVLPALIRKLHEGGEVTLWGDGSPRREFLHADDLAEACYVCMDKYDESSHINVGVGEDITIKELAEMIAKVVGFTGEIMWNSDVPNGTLRKVLNVDKIKELGWKPKITLEEGLKKTYEWYCHNMV